MTSKENKSLDISQSKLKTWRQCRKAYYYKYVLKITRKFKPMPFMRGTIIHNMLEAHYLKKDPWLSFNRDIRENEKALRINPEEYGDLKGHLKGLMKGYFDFYKKEDLTPIKVEHSFRVKLINKIYLTGKIDLVAKSQKMKWIAEHKCHNVIPNDSSVPYTNLQSALYLHAYEVETGKKLDGVLWNYLWGKPPSVPSLLKNGEMSKRSTNTLWSIYKSALIKAKLDPDDYLDVKKKLKGNENNFYQRKYVPFHQTLIDHIVEDTQTTAKEIEKSAGHDQTRNLGKHCDYCEFKNLCLAQLKGLDDNYILKADFKERKKDEERHPTQD